MVSTKDMQFPIIKKVWCGHHRRALGYLGGKSNTWRKNWIWIYANHHNQYILTVNCGLPNHWVCYNGYLESSGFSGAPPQGGWNTAHQCRLIWYMCNIMVLSNQYGSSTPYHPLRTYRYIAYFSVTIWIKYNLVTIPHFWWAGLDFK